MTRTRTALMLFEASLQGYDNRKQELRRQAAVGDPQANLRSIQMRKRAGEDVSDIDMAHAFHAAGHTEEAHGHLIRHLQTNIFPQIHHHVTAALQADLEPRRPEVNTVDGPFHDREHPARLAAAEARRLASRFDLPNLGHYYGTEGRDRLPHVTGLGLLHNAHYPGSNYSSFYSNADAQAFAQSYDLHHSWHHGRSSLEPGDDHRPEERGTRPVWAPTVMHIPRV